MYKGLMAASLITTSLFCASHSLAAQRTVDLHVGYKTVNFTGKHVKAIAVNNQIPGPTLHFQQGDHVTINVYNHLDRGTAVHWHGILLPWRMDGVAHVTQEPIPPGGVFHYEYTLKQSGTYWYHAHADLQEQQGLLGAYIVDPPSPPPYHYNKDFPIVLSDWSDTNPDQIYANLKKDGDYYSQRFPLQPSLSHYMHSYNQATSAGKKKLSDAYSMMQQMRMSPYDFSDVAYDAFLINGHPATKPWKAKVKVGDVVRLRFIDAGGSTQFHIKIPGTSMQVVHIQGNDIKPYMTDSLYMAPGETYDVLVKITQNKPYIIYVESNDKLGKVYGALVTSTQQHVDFSNVMPFPEPELIVMMHHEKSEHDMHSMHNMHNMPAMSNMEMVKTKYENVQSDKITNQPNKPYTVINMELSGWMGQYVWFLNGLPEYRAKPIVIEPGKRYRIIFKNDTMMHHPMHLHGHWFILRNNHGAYDPLLHTIDVPPNATVVADFDADANGGFWYFHCHNLFHMKAGMANIVRYQETPIPNFHGGHHSHQEDEDYNMRHLTAHPARWYRANEVEFGANPVTNDYTLTAKAMFGPDFNKLQLYMNDAEMEKGVVDEADLDVFYWHLVDQFWAVKGGINYFYRPSKKPYWQPGIGLEGLMPYFIAVDARGYYRAGSAKLDLELSRDTQLTNNFFIRLALRGIAATNTVAQDEIGNGLNQARFILTPYLRVMPGLNVFAEYERQRYYGRTSELVRADGESVTENTYTVGVDFLW